MPISWRPLPAILALTTTALTACGSTHPAAQETAASAASTGPNSTGPAPIPGLPPGVTGYLYTAPNIVVYLQWQTDRSGDFQGTKNSVYITGTAPGEQATVDANHNFFGHIDNSTITLNIDLHTDTGTISGTLLTLNVTMSDGSIRPVTYHQAGPDDYNKALAALRTTVTDQNQQAQAQQASASAQALLQQETTAAINQLTGDYNDLTTATADPVGTLAEITDIVSRTDRDVETTHADEQVVLTEAAGGAAPNTVCVDSNTVIGDANGVQGDANGVSGYLNGLTSYLKAIRTDMDAVKADLAAVRQYQLDYAGGQGAPSPADVDTAISAASDAVSHTISTANPQIDQTNNDVTTAFGYATKASKAGQNCGSPGSPRDPIGHIS